MTNFAQDMRVKTAWGVSLTEWNNAPESQRRYWREHLTSALYFQEER